MKKQIQLKEHGQALVMIAIAALVLFAFTALAIDGSIVFSDRRHSQNASDTAVLAAALAKVQKESKGLNVDWQQAGLARAAENSYDNNDPLTEVQVKLCSTAIVTEDGLTFPCQGLPNGANPAEYIHVHIKSVVQLTLAQVLGWKTMTNHTDAVSRAMPQVPTNWYDGYGIASTHQGCWDNKNGEPFEIGGSSTSFVNGAGVLVTAVCAGEDTVSVVGNPQLHTTTGVCAPGTTNLPSNDEASLGNPGLQDSCNVPPPDYYTVPDEPQCKNFDGSTRYGSVTKESNGVWVAEPGTYTGAFPDVQGGQATIKIKKGVYCLNKGIDVQGGWKLTTDTKPENGSHDPATEGALFYIPGGHIAFDGGADMFLHAISQTTDPDFSPFWLNLLIYKPKSNAEDVKITGNSGSSFTGTILAPGSVVTLQGSTTNSGGTVELDSQIIADTVKITGNTDLTIVYNESNNAQTLTNPGIALIK